MNIIIRSWFGRLGNNIIQVLNAILIALYYNYNIILPGHKYFNKKYIILNSEIKIRDYKITNKDNFYFRYQISNIDIKAFEENNEKALEILKSCFIIKPRINRFKPSDNILLNENDVLIHIRSGDIFINNPHTEYIMPPLSYYEKIINDQKFNKQSKGSFGIPEGNANHSFYLISEDRKNPCINELLKKYPEIIYLKQSLDDDIKLILSAHNIITSFGTFVHALLSISKNIKNLYKVSYDYNNTLLKDINIYKADLTEYHQLMRPWKNTAEQRKLMLNYQSVNNFVKTTDIKHI